ncbi:MAG: DUF1634 domain-containing protein [Dehalococcoidia bacterium]|nr:DUF1634 domain-containing protein [Dehalococcoidia bacterium]
MECRYDNRHEKLHRLNRRISLVLRAGIAVSLILIVCGLIIFLVSGAPHTSPLIPVASLIDGFAALNPAAFITAGVILILLLPISMLILSLAYFAAVREKQPVIVCIVLLVMLASSLILALK